MPERGPPLPKKMARSSRSTFNRDDKWLALGASQVVITDDLIADALVERLSKGHKG